LRGLQDNRLLKQKDPRPGARDLSRGSTQIAPMEHLILPITGLPFTLISFLFGLKLAGGFGLLGLAGSHSPCLTVDLTTTYSSCVFAIMMKYTLF